MLMVFPDLSMGVCIGASAMAIAGENQGGAATIFL